MIGHRVTRRTTRSTFFSGSGSQGQGGQAVDKSVDKGIGLWISGGVGLWISKGGARGQ